MKRNRVIFWGVFFILLAVAMVLTQTTGFGAGLVWSQVLWGLVLLMVIVESALNRCFTGIFLPLGIAYNIFGGLLGLPVMARWVPVLAGALLGIGMDILVGSRWRRRHRKDGERFAYRHGRNRGDWEGSRRVSEGSEEDFPKVEVSFGSLRRYINSRQLRGGDFSVSFGELKVDLTDALPAVDATLQLSCSFGELQLIVPRHWNIRDDIQASLATVEYEGRYVEPEEGAPQLTLTGDVSLGHISIMYV